MEIAPLITAMGLGSAAGLNLHLPLLILGLSDRFSQAINLPQPYSILSEPLVLAALGVLALIEIIADKVPVVDHVWHSIGLILHPLAGALVFLATTQGIVDPSIAVVAGLVLAGTTHAARSVVRPASTAATAGAGNPALSTAEDFASVGLSLSAIFLPFLALFLTFGLFAAIAWGWSKAKKLKERVQAQPNSNNP